MARHVSLSWTNAYFDENKELISGLTQVIERKVAEGAWEETSIVPVDEEGVYSAQDVDLGENTETVQHQYRIVTVNGATRTNGNEITVDVLPETPAVVPPVEDLEGQYVPEPEPAPEP